MTITNLLYINTGHSQRDSRWSLIFLSRPVVVLVSTPSLNPTPSHRPWPWPWPWPWSPVSRLWHWVWPLIGRPWPWLGTRLPCLSSWPWSKTPITWPWPWPWPWPPVRAGCESPNVLVVWSWLPGQRRQQRNDNTKDEQPDRHHHHGQH